MIIVHNAHLSGTEIELDYSKRSREDAGNHLRFDPRTHTVDHTAGQGVEELSTQELESLLNWITIFSNGNQIPAEFILS